jgi:hypothetical protein
MYVGCSGHNRIRTRFAEGTIAYIHTSFLGRSRSYKLIGDVRRYYMWSAIDLWEKNISRILLRFGFSCLYIGEQGCPQIW